MRKAVFITGYGTAYTCHEKERETLELYPETLWALRFLSRRGFLPVLATPDFQEYKWLLSALKDKTVSVLHWDTARDDLDQFMERHGIGAEGSYLITDGTCIKSPLAKRCRVILVLTGRGVQTLNSKEYKEVPDCRDVCKNIYAAAFSIALDR